MADETFRLKVMLEKGEVQIHANRAGLEIWPRSVPGWVHCQTKTPRRRRIISFTLTTWTPPMTDQFRWWSVWRSTC